MIRRLLGKPPYWTPTLKGPLRPLWPLYVRYSWWRERRDLIDDERAAMERRG